MPVLTGDIQPLMRLNPPMTRAAIKHLVGKEARFQIKGPTETVSGVGELDFADGELFIRAVNQNVRDLTGGGSFRSLEVLIP